MLTRKQKQKVALSGLSEFLPSAHNQGAVQFELAAEVRIFRKTRGRRKVLKDSGRIFRKTWWQDGWGTVDRGGRS